MTRAALYLRISQDATGQHLGVTRQREDCEELAKQLDWDVVEVFTDNDVSATSGKARPAYRKMLAAVDAGDLDAIIAWHPDRLYRKVADLGDLVDVCKRNNTQIATAKAGTIDLTTPTGRLVAGLLAQVATYEGEAKSDRWRRSWQQGREAGRIARTGSRTFGYTKEGKIIEPEAEIAREMAARVMRGDGLHSICRWINRLGVTTTRGGEWTTQGFKRYMLNPRVAGWSTLGGTIVAEGQWDPILDRETWETVRAILETRSTGRAKPRVSVLNGMIFCGKCGHRLVTSSAANGRSYRCPRRPGMNGCGGVTGKAEAIEEIVEAYAQAALADPAIRARIAELRAEPSGVQAEIAALELRVTELERELDQPGVPVATVLRAIDRAKTRQGELLSTLARSTVTPIPLEGEVWPDDITRRRALVDLVVAGAVLKPAKRIGSRLGFDPERVLVVERT